VNTTLAPRPTRTSRLRDVFTNPWGETRFLWVVGIGYLLWSLIPVAEAVLFSFNRTRSITQWDGFSLRWYTWDPDGSVLNDPNLQHAIVQSLKLASLTALIAVPLGVAFALSLHHWRGRGSGGANFLMLFAFVTPELILAVSLFLLFINVFEVVGLGSIAQLIGLVVLGVAYPVVIVRARVLSMGPEYEEAAMDLGASPIRALVRVTLPLLGPSIFASAAIVFAFSLDDFVIVNQLSRDAASQTVSMAIYGAARTSPTPATNAIGTILLTASTTLIAVAFVVYRRTARRRGDTARFQGAA
jgi:spermidine/putrescine transport system permease protein